MKLTLITGWVIAVTLLCVWMPAFTWMKTRHRQSFIEFFLGGFLISGGVGLFGALLWHPILYIVRIDEHPELLVVSIYALFGAIGGGFYRLFFVRNS